MASNKARRQVTKILVSAGGGFFAFIFLLLLMFGGIGSSADAPSNVASYYTTDKGLQEYNEIYQKVIDEVKSEHDYDVHFYELGWYYALLEKHPTYEVIKKEGEWIATNKATPEQIINRYKTIAPYQENLTTFSESELLNFLKDFQKVDELIAEAQQAVETSTGGTTGATSSPADFQSVWYIAPKNPSTKSGYMGQCTWYAWGRANEVFKGKYSGMPAGNARDWMVQWGLANGKNPSANAIAVWGGSNQHVAYVESYDGKTITISEGNYQASKSCVNYMCSLRDAVNFTNTWSGTLEELKGRQGASGIFLGFLYLE